LHSIKLSIDDFKPIELKDKPLFDKHYSKYPPVHSDNLFTTMISWKDYGNYEYTFLEDNLIIMSKIKNQIRFRPPSGKFNKNIFDQVLQLAKKQNSTFPFGVIESKTKEWLSKNYPKLELIPHRDYFDYVYQSSDLAELNGSDYRKIRNRLNKFKNNNNYSLEKITENNIDMVKEFLNRWCLWKDCESDPLLEAEKKAILYSISHFFNLELSGIAIQINGDIEAIAVYEGMNPDTAVVHYEKGSPDYDGIYKAINQETAKIIQKDFNYINRESDMGLPGLKKAKMSYHPHHMVEVYHVDKNNIIV
jgi:hypothetical protein